MSKSAKGSRNFSNLLSHSVALCRHIYSSSFQGYLCQSLANTDLVWIMFYFSLYFLFLVDGQILKICFFSLWPSAPYIFVALLFFF